MDENGPLCPFCRSGGACDHLLVVLDLQYGEAFAGLLWDNPVFETLLAKVDRLAAAEHAEVTGKALRKLARDLSKLKREISPLLDNEQKKSLKGIVGDLRSLSQPFASCSSRSRPPKALRQLQERTSWTPGDPTSPVSIYGGANCRYLIGLLKEAGARGEIQEFHGGQVGMTSDVCNLYAEDPSAVLEECESMLPE